MSKTTTEEQEQLSGPAFFGKEVRAWRMRAGMSQRELGVRANYGQQYVAKVEAGERLASRSFAKVCDEVFGTPGTFARLREWASLHGYPAWFVPYVQLERQATGILDYSASLVMGMFQTADYARAVFQAVQPRASAAKIDVLVDGRLRRREVMEKEAPPLLWCVLNEACLRTVVGGPEVMSEQLAHLLTEAESPHITLQVLPFEVGAPPAGDSFTLLAFDEGPNIVYTDTAIAGQVIDGPEEVEAATAAYDRLRAAALNPDESLAVIRRVMEEYTR
ncbi:MULTISPECIES: helix-turn-helix transcriptional regulator [unclassified Streptomyces]|uniref:helix-turn-helix domain-containing protein n=1 Tax=unclassified Streptomyces TaxID=2593676 RepID=UPI00336A7893